MDDQNTQPQDNASDEEAKNKLLSTLKKLAQLLGDDSKDKISASMARNRATAISKEIKAKGSNLDQLQAMIAIEAAIGGVAGSLSIELHQQSNSVMRSMFEAFQIITKSVKSASLNGDGTVKFSPEETLALNMALLDGAKKGQSYHNKIVKLQVLVEHAKALTAYESTKILHAKGEASDEMLDQVTKHKNEAVAELDKYLSDDDSDSDDGVEGLVDSLKKAMDANPQGGAMKFNIDGETGKVETEEMSVEDAMRLINGDEADDPNEDDFPTI